MCDIYNGSGIDDSLTVASYNKFHDQNKRKRQCLSSGIFFVFVFDYNSYWCNVYITEHSTYF